MGSVATMPVQSSQVMLTQPNMTNLHYLRGATATGVPNMNTNHTQLTQHANQTSRHNQTHSTGHNNHEHQHEPHELHPNNYGNKKQQGEGDNMRIRIEKQEIVKKEMQK